MDIETLKFPIGHFKPIENASNEQISEQIATIEQFPGKLKEAVGGLTDEQLDTPYRDGGWTIRQVVHHLADSHMNAFIRFKLTLTEEIPVVKPFHEDLWANLPDSVDQPIEASLQIITGVHARWAKLLKSLDRDDLKLTFMHPVQKREMKLEFSLGLYSWHSMHHLAHITVLRKRERF